MREVNQRKEEGITILVLTITIIILLILAGITIISLTGENGLIKNAGQAKEETEISNEKEILERATAGAMAQDSRGNIKEERLQNKLNGETGAGKTEVTDTGEEFEVLFKDTNRYYIVDKTGNIEIAPEIKEDKSPGDITKDEEGNELTGRYEIWSIEDLCDFSNRVNNGKTFNGEEVYLMQSLNFKSKRSYENGNIVTTGKIQSCNTIEELQKILTEGEGFYPIGDRINNYGYQGSFDGNNFEIKNLYINRSGTVGFFCNISNWNQNDIVIKNIKITGNVTGTEDVGAICGNISGTNSSIQIINCITTAIINGDGCAGGIVGSVSGTYTNLRVQNCINYGNVKGSDAGGIVGYCYYIEIYNCYNEGEIVGVNKSNGYNGAGGIIGTGMRRIIIKNSYNKGNIKGISKGGGIIGYNDWGEVTLENCYNIGMVSGATLGGIAGRLFLSNDMLTTKNCFYLNTNISIGIGYIHGGSEEKEDVKGFSQEEIKSNEVLNSLNNYVEQNLNNQEVELKKWKFGGDGYPTFVE